MSETLFKFKRFEVTQENCAMKINTDGVLLGAWVDVRSRQNILDIGTGSGVIAMMLAQRTDSASITGIDIDEPSIKEAIINMQNCTWSDRLSGIHSSIQDFVVSYEGQFDLIVSNPPFFSGGTLSATQEKTDVRHTTKLSHSDLLRSACSLLSDDGEFSVVLPYLEGLRFVEIARQYRLYIKRITEVKSYPNQGVERRLMSFGKMETDVSKDEIVIRESQNKFDVQYKELTQDFYLKF